MRNTFPTVSCTHQTIIHLIRDLCIGTWPASDRNHTRIPRAAIMSVRQSRRMRFERAIRSAPRLHSGRVILGEIMPL